MAELNNKAIRTISRMMAAGYDNEKAILAMTLEDILALPNVSVAEIGLINEIQKAVKSGKVISYLGGGEV